MRQTKETLPLLLSCFLAHDRRQVPMQKIFREKRKVDHGKKLC